MTALWVVIPRLTFPNSCLATVFYAVGMVMVCQNGHIGSRLKAMVVIPGAWTVGSVCGGITVTSSSSHSNQSNACYALPVWALRPAPRSGCICCSKSCCFILVATAISCKLVSITEKEATTFIQALATFSPVASTVLSTVYVFGICVCSAFRESVF